MFRRLFLIIIFIIVSSTPAFAQLENYTFKLSQSTTGLDFWTTPPSERVFKDSPVPTETDNEITVYAARNEFEPFQVMVKPAGTNQVTISLGDFGNGIFTELFQVKYVYIDQATDILGRTGDYPDPLWPIANGETVGVTANENTAFWINIYVPSGISSGDYTANVSINGVPIPVRLHVFNFDIPAELHVKSQMNFDYNVVLSKYSVAGTGAEYWMYVDMMKQYFINHRLTSKSPLWSGGVTSGGAAPYIDYYCQTEEFVDNDGIWGFEYPADRYLNGNGFNNGTGFPSFMTATFINNDPAQEQRGTLTCTEGGSYSAGGWVDPYPFITGSFNDHWFNEYIPALESYLSATGFLDKAYYYIANEPQDPADYDATAWYAQELKRVAPSLKLMVSEQPRPEIYNHATYPNAKIDIWLPVLNQYNPTESWDRALNHGEETWVYFLHGTRPPYFNPITLDHPGIESKFIGWFLWKYRVRGIAYYSMNDWSPNPWTDPMTSSHNGDTFMFYPPSEDNSNIPYGSNNHRLVPSIRLELMRDSMEDYEYLYMLNGASQPNINQSNPSDSQADKIITGLTSYTRSSEFMYNLRRVIGEYIGGEIASIPDLQPPALHPRAQGPPGDYYINFQDPYETFASNPYGNPQMRDELIDGVSYRFLDYNNRSYYAIGAAAYDEDKGFGWYGNIINQPVEGRDPWGQETDETKRTYVGDNYGKVNTFDFALPNGNYNVTLCVGRPRSNDAHNNATIEGVVFVNDEPTTDDAQYIIRSHEITVGDNSLTIEIGLTTMDEYTMLDYLEVVAVTENPVINSIMPTSGPVGTTVILAGSGFTNAVNVDFYGTPASFTINSDTQITTIVPPNASSGPIGISTGVAYFTGPVFTVTIPQPPYLEDIDPEFGPEGTNVMIYGANLGTAFSVKFNGVDATFTPLSDYEISVTVPVGATTGVITVENGDGQTTGPVFVVTEDRPPCDCGPLPAPGSGETVLTVATMTELQAVLSDITAPTTIYLTSGTYNVAAFGSIFINHPYVTLRSQSGNPADVTLVGSGPVGQLDEYGVHISASHVTIADLTIQDMYTNGIYIGTDSYIENILIHNVIVNDAMSDLLQMNSPTSNGTISFSKIRCSEFAYASQITYYTSGISLRGVNYAAITDNLFENISTIPSEGNEAVGIGAWSGCTNITIERNRFIDCDGAIQLGNYASGLQHSGGIVRNNFVKGDENAFFGIALGNAANTYVIFNTLYAESALNFSITAFGSNTVNSYISNNFTDAGIAGDWSGATAVVANNITTANAVDFLDAANGDLHLISNQVAAVNAGVDMDQRIADIDCESVTDPGVDVGADEYYPLDMPILSVTPAIQTVTANSGTTSFTVENTGSGTLNWSAAVDPNSLWLTITNGSSGTDTGDISASFIKNTGAARIGTITVSAPGIPSSPVVVEVHQGANQPPHTPSSPTPADQATEISINTSLSWTGGDPEDDSVTYYIFLGTHPDTLYLITSGTENFLATPGTLAYSRTYYWRINAEDVYEHFTVGTVWSFTTEPAPNYPPDTPSDPGPADQATDVPVSSPLTWMGSDPNGDSVTYDVYLGTTNPPSTVVSNDQSGSSFDPDLAYSTTYYWKIRATDEHGASTLGPVWSFTTEPDPNEPPITPTEPEPYDQAANVPISSTLAWYCYDPDQDSVTYDVYLGTTNPPSTVVSNDQSGPSFDPVLAYSTTYYWKIRATDEHGASTLGPVWSFTTEPDPNEPPITPTEPEPYDQAANVPISSTLAWYCYDPDQDSVTYDVYLGTTNPPSTVVSNDQSGSSFDPDLAYSTTYYWKIRATDEHGASTLGPVWSFTTEGAPNSPPHTPSNPNPALGAQNVSVNTLVSWTGGDPNSDPVTYDILLDTGNPPVTVVANDILTSYFSPDLDYDLRYYWQVIATDSQGASTSGPIWNFFTESTPNNPPYAPTNPTPSNGATNVLNSTTLIWSGTDPDGDYLAYDVYLDTVNPPQELIFDNIQQNYHGVNLSYGRTYFWRIIASDEHGASTIGPIWSFSTQPEPDITADFSGGPTIGDAPLTVSFQDHSTTINAIISQWNWTFGDGGTSTLQNPSYTYQTVGLYTVTLIVSNGQGLSDTKTRTNYITVNPPPPCTPPVNISATDGTYTNYVRINWSAGDGSCDFYRVYRSPDNNPANAQPISNWTWSMAYNDYSTTPAVDYYYWVQAAHDNQGYQAGSLSSGDSGWRSLAAPATVSASDGTWYDQIQVTWSTVSGATHYRVYRHTLNDPETAAAISGWQESTELIDTEVDPIDLYYYWVQAAISANGTRPSAWSLPDYGHALGETQCAAPFNILAGDGLSPDGTTITWQFSGDCEYYRVFRNINNTPSTATAVSGWLTDMNYTDTAGVPGTNYYYWVRAAETANGYNISSYSNSDVGWRQIRPPATVSASDGTYSDRVQISWTATAGANFYRVYRSQVNNSGSAQAITDWMIGTFYEDYTAIPDVPYYYWIKGAHDHEGTNASLFSTPAEPGHVFYDPTCQAPLSVEASDGDLSARVRVTWAPAEQGCDYYRVYRNNSNQASGAWPVSDWITALSYDDLTAAWGQTYYYWVKSARNNSGSHASFLSDSDDGLARVPGDVNSDGIFNELDFDQVVAYILGLIEFTPQQVMRADENGDSRVNMIDLVILLQWLD